MSFSGFSEEDIRKFNNNGKNNETNEKLSQKPPEKLVALKKPAKKNSGKSNEIKRIISTEAPIPENAKLSSTREAVTQPNIEAIMPEAVLVEVSLENQALDQMVDETRNRETKLLEEQKIETIAPMERRKEKMNLEEFEARQKLIEEQNRKRKEVLSKALADRTKRTQEEAQRLQEIQEEFQHLDALLSCDVRILRKQIEAASVDFTDCQKKYHKIEKEFLEAKLLLHQKLEKKEMLTEHLCTIIEKNEERKADKLNELLSKLQMDPGEVRENGEH